jgi:hypothetical protein
MSSRVSEVINLCFKLNTSTLILLVLSSLDEENRLHQRCFNANSLLESSEGMRE